MLATVPFGMVYGALAAKDGLTLTENLAMSGLVFAGASQFVALEFWTHPLPFWTILRLRAGGQPAPRPLQRGDRTKTR